VIVLQLVVGQAEGLAVVPHLVQQGLLLGDLVAQSSHLLLVLLAVLSELLLQRLLDVGLLRLDVEQALLLAQRHEQVPKLGLYLA